MVRIVSVAAAIAALFLLPRMPLASLSLPPRRTPLLLLARTMRAAVLAVLAVASALAVSAPTVPPVGQQCFVQLLQFRR